MFEDVLDGFVSYADELEFEYSDVDKAINYLSDRNRKTLGLCRYDRGRYHIFLNPNMLKFNDGIRDGRYDDSGEQLIKSVIAHELVHTLPGCMNHGRRFHEKGNLVKRLMGYTIDTKADVDGSAYFRKYLPKTNYMLKCDNCGNEISKPTLSDPVKNPFKYRCPKCRGNLSSYKLNKSTDEYELYRSSDSEPEYKYQLVCPDCDWRMNFKTRNQKFKNLLHDLDTGNQLYCPKCGKPNVFALDDDRIVKCNDEYIDWLD